jgi:hypothetical protein
MSFVFRGGIGFPTATDGRDPTLTRFASASPRLTDLALATDNWYLRLGVSPLLYGHNLFLRADIGFDVNLQSDDYHFLRLNLGGGVDLGIVALSLELVNSVTFGTFTRYEDRLFHSLALTTRFMGEHLQPFLSFGLPLDDYRRDSVHFFISGGIQVAF